MSTSNSDKPKLRGSFKVALVDEKKKKTRHEILKRMLKGAGIFGLGLIGSAALVAGVGLALGAFGIPIGLPVVGHALVTAGGWLANAIPALGASGVVLPIAIGAILGIAIAALAIWGIYKLLKKPLLVFGNDPFKPKKPTDLNNNINISLTNETIKNITNEINEEKKTIVEVKKPINNNEGQVSIPVVSSVKNPIISEKKSEKKGEPVTEVISEETISKKKLEIKASANKPPSTSEQPASEQPASEQLNN